MVEINQNGQTPAAPTTLIEPKIAKMPPFWAFLLVSGLLLLQTYLIPFGLLGLFYEVFASGWRLIYLQSLVYLLGIFSIVLANAIFGLLVFKFPKLRILLVLGIILFGLFLVISFQRDLFPIYDGPEVLELWGDFTFKSVGVSHFLYFIPAITFALIANSKQVWTLKKFWFKSFLVGIPIFGSLTILVFRSPLDSMLSDYLGGHLLIPEIFRKTLHYTPVRSF